MTRIILCNLCHTQVEEDALLVYLVKKHQWTEVPQTRPTESPSVATSTELTPQTLESPGPQQSIEKPVAQAVQPCTCFFCKAKIEPTLAVEHMQQCQKRTNKLAEKGKQGKPEQGRVLCGYCNNKVHAQNIMNHVRQQHLSEQPKSANKPPELTNKQAKQPKPKVVMLTKRGTRTVGFRQCDNCKVVHMDHWTYQFSNGTSKTVCRFCKGMLLDKAAKRKTDVLDHCVPGSAMNGKRR